VDDASGLGRLAHSARWFVFAKTADDRRRSRYWRLGARLRRRDLDRRRAAAAELPPPCVEIDPARAFVSVPGNTFSAVESVVGEVCRLRAQLSLGARGDEKPYLLDHPIDTLPASSPLLRLALDADVVATASYYLGMVPLLTGVTVLASPHVPGPPSGSQLFHSDWEDVRQVKMFVNCTPVEPQNGPLTGVTAAASRRVKKQVGYRYGGLGFRLSDDQVLPRVSPDEVGSFTGSPGTVTFIDTSSCLHYGSRLAPGAAERLVVQFQYLTPPAFDLVLRRRPARPFGIDGEGLTPLQRSVLSPRGRASP
jgi:hypothetical protein